MKRKAPGGKVASGLFGDAAPEANTPAAAYRFNVDGGSRGNPGPAAYGVVVHDAAGKLVAQLKKYIGRSTNNVAEYYGLIAALDYAQSHGLRAVRIEADSELMVKQMRGLYKVKSADLQPLYERARKMAQSCEFFRIEHVYREQNREADRLANEAMDEADGRTSGAKAGGAKAESAARSEQPKPTSPIVAAPGAPGQPRLIPARYRGGVLYLLEDIGLPDGTVCKIILHSVYDPSKK